MLQTTENNLIPENFPQDTEASKCFQEVQSSFPREFEAEELLKANTVLLTGNDVQAKRHEIREYFHKTYDLYESLFEILKDHETFYKQPEKLRHPLVFYFGHTAVFFINKLRVANITTERIDKDIESTCAIGVDEMSWDDLNPNHYVWPSIESLYHYRDKVRKVVDDVIMNATLELPITWKSPLWIVLMGIEHERIHLETSSVLFRQLSLDQVKPHPLFTLCPYYAAPDGFSEEEQTSINYTSPLPLDKAPINGVVPIKGGLIGMGKPFDHNLYGWDNEYGVHAVQISDFSTSKYLVSNAEFYNFMQDGGYETEHYWTKEGWGFVQYMKTKHPVFWVPSYDATTGNLISYKYRSLTHEIDMPWSWPVDVNYLEAKAFCNWKNEQLEKEGKLTPSTIVRLPTEEEYMYLRQYLTPNSVKNDDQPYWTTNNSSSSAFQHRLIRRAGALPESSSESSCSPENSCVSNASSPNTVLKNLRNIVNSTTAPGNISLYYWSSSCPVNMFNFHNSGVYDIIGNVWQHTETPMAPFRNFKVHPAYDDFTVPTFDNMHNMIKGGSWISTGNEATYHARYAFRRHFYQHAGFRYVIGEKACVPQTETRDHIENDPIIANSIADNYTQINQDDVFSVLSNLPNYSIQLAEIVKAAIEKTNLSATRIMEIGCSTGRTVFELAKYYDFVTGFDFSTRFIQIGTLLQTIGSVKYNIPEEGDLCSFHSVNLAELGLAHVTSKVEFVQGDASNLALSKFEPYDVIVLSRNFTKLSSPKQFLTTIHTLLKPDGLFILATTNDWTASQLNKNEWIGGYKDENSGEIVHCFDTLHAILQQHFTLLQGPLNIPQLQRQLGRVSMLSMNSLTIWQKKHD